MRIKQRQGFHPLPSKYNIKKELVAHTLLPVSIAFLQVLHKKKGTWNMFGYEEYLVSFSDDRYTYLFPNGYGVVVFSSPLSLGGLQGLWEVRLNDHQDKPVTDTYGSPFTFGHNTPSEVKALLDLVHAIPSTWRNPQEKKTKLQLCTHFKHWL